MQIVSIYRPQHKQILEIFTLLREFGQLLECSVQWGVTWGRIGNWLTMG
jgi:hypothetical protein